MIRFFKYLNAQSENVCIMIVLPGIFGCNFPWELVASTR